MAKIDKEKKVTPIYIEGDKQANNNMLVLSPKNFDDIQALIRSLRDGQSIIFKLEGVDKEVAQRMLDFVSGAAFALGGSMKRIEKTMFLVTRAGMGIMFQ